MTRMWKLAAVLAIVATPTALAAQGGASTFDRTKPPAAGPTPAFRLPAWTVDTLSNGARLVVVQRRDLPIVTFSMHFQGGTNQLGTRPGVSSFVGAMLSEGTTSRSGDQLTNDLALLGTDINFSIGRESGSVSFSSLSRNFDQAADIMVDMMLHSTYPEAALERLRAQRLAAYTRGQDVVGVVAGQVTPKLLYGDQPYGQVVNEADLKAVTRADVAQLAKAFFVPVNATVYVVGDMSRAEAKAKLERAFKAWPASGQKLAISYPAAPALGPTTISIVNMPDKPQSQLVLARTLPPEYSPDMPKIDVMNAIMGGMFQSRLNADIREAHGFSYGFNSFPQWADGPGMLRAQGAVTREKTDSSLILAMRDIRGLTGSVPVTSDELTAARNSLTLSLPSDLQSNSGVAGVVSRVVDNDLPQDWWTRYIAAVNATTSADVSRMAATYMDPDHLMILIVGDSARIASSIAATGIAPVVFRDKTGKLISK
ncbi:MAG TPA: pitrilysin family protein [Gemmatimonadaceae bacterium]|nr:pitrilysin family protein [Gemmatimonadaceae bacterium]